MTVSVIIPTYNGANKLPLILESVKNQNIQPDEVLVVVDGSTDSSLQILEGLQKKMPGLRVVVQENNGRAAVRNKGAEMARSELLVFFDDDMIPEKDCLKVHMQHHQQFPNSVLTGAQIDMEDNRSEIQRYKASLSRKWTEPFKGKGQRPLAKEDLFITAANFSVTKEVFIKVGGFDSRLTDAEDFDLAVRAFKAGVPLFYEYKAFAWHNDEITARSYLHRLRQYHKAHQRLKQLKPDLYQGFHQLSPTLPKGVKEKIFLLFAHRYWVDWMDNGSWKFLLPRKARYKLYDLITTANGVYYPEKVLL